MIEWEVTETGFRILDANKSELAVTSPDVRVEATDANLPRPVDETLSCTTRELRLPIAVVFVSAVSGEQRHEIGNDTDPLELPEGEYVVDVDAEIKTYLLIDGPATIQKTADFDEVVVTFPEERQFVAGFRSRHERPAYTITTPTTPEGIATTLSHLSSAHKTSTPDRSYPTLRGHPPLVETGDELDVPAEVAAATPDGDVEVVVPPSFDQLFVVAPLAYYLQADVTIQDRMAPLLKAPAAGVEHEFEPPPYLERSAARLLRKTFFLDTLVRNAGPFGTTLAEASILDALGLRAESLYGSNPAERLAAYLDVPFSAIEHRMPEWHLSMYVSPEPQHVSTLPFLLDKLALIFLPRTSELEGSELVERSLDDFYRGPTSGPGAVASVDIVKPELREGRSHGWLADGVPIDVFKSTPTAYHNRLAFLDRDDYQRGVTVVLNDEEMGREHSDVETIYRQRAEEYAMDLTFEKNLSVDELASVFESSNDFVHYIGHCEEDGLRCPSGYLSTTSLGGVETETFFLNACGSFHEGMELVEKGAVAGAVTFSQVLNEHAVRVGSAFARLLMHGFGIERALRLARRRIMMGKDYAVVGDGTHSLPQSESRLPTSVTLERVEDDQFLLTYDQYTTKHTGAHYHPYVEGNEYADLCGNDSQFALDHEAVVEFLSRSEVPVIYDGDFYWSEELESVLEDERPEG
jgi:hypothetical protein